MLTITGRRIFTSSHQIAKIIAWAREHRESPALKWTELNERG
jgi:hypothetical protein